MSIKTPIDLNYQINAQNALRKGIESYDRRHGWRGPITNRFKDKSWKKKIKEHKIDPTLGWNFAEVEEISENSLSIKVLENNEKSNIFLKDINWAVKKDI